MAFKILEFERVVVKSCWSPDDAEMWWRCRRASMKLSSAIFSESFRPMMCSNCFCVSVGAGESMFHMIHAVPRHRREIDDVHRSDLELAWYLDEVALRSRENVRPHNTSSVDFESTRSIP